MSETYSATFAPRYYECDADGQLHSAYYLRYMLQAAVEAGAADDLGLPEPSPARWLEHLGDVGVQVDRPAIFGEALNVETRLTRRGPPIWRREYVMKRSGSGETLARGFSDAFEEDDSQDDTEGQSGPDVLDGASDSDIRWAEFAARKKIASEYEPTPPAWDGPVEDPPEPPPHAYRARWLVGWTHLDVSAQLEPAGLTQQLREIEAHAAEAAGWTEEREMQQAVVWEPREFRLEFFGAIRCGDELNVVSYIGEVGDDDMIRHALVNQPDGNLVARARTRWVCFDRESDERCPVPSDWLLHLEGQFAER